jgi:D-alanyl-D-alanine carboxypeptidase
MKFLSRPMLTASLALLFCLNANAQSLENQVQQIAASVVGDSSVPSASIAIVQDGKIRLVQAYGHARLAPQKAATPDLRYGIGSISKQFTAAAVMMLVEEGKLSLEDKVSQYLPQLTRANEITIRELLSHTAGYQDNYPQDYTPNSMKHNTTAQYIMDSWAKKPLDFEPGTRWQYSNTGFTVAGAIVEKVSGKPMFELLQERIFRPLGMKSATEITEKTPSNVDVEGYERHALSAPRVAAVEAPGWLFAAGELSMTAEDLAKWDISLMNESVLKPASYRAMETEVLLNNGVGTRYGLGLAVMNMGTHRVLEHSGEISGFVSDNIVLPDEHAAVVVLTNMEGPGAGAIARQIAQVLVRKPDSTGANAEARARAAFEGLIQGKIDRSQFTDNCNGYFDAATLRDYAESLSPLGPIVSFTSAPVNERGGMLHRSFTVRFANKAVSINAYETKDGKYEQFLVDPAS